MTTKSEERDDVAELVADLVWDNPAPSERWFRRDAFDPMYTLAVIDAAVRKGYVETKGSRSGPDFEMRLTRLGRSASGGAEGGRSRSDGYAALERMTTAAKLAFVPAHVWTVQNGCSWTRIGTQGEDGNVLRPTVAKDGFPDIIAAHGVMDYLMAAQPLEVAKVAALVADLEQEVRELRARLDDHGAARPMNKTTLSGTVLEALRELAKHRGGPYWWRQASMKKLADMGLVEAWHPERKVNGRMAHRITPKGVDAIARLGG